MLSSHEWLKSKVIFQFFAKRTLLAQVYITLWKYLTSMQQEDQLKPLFISEPGLYRTSIANCSYDSFPAISEYPGPRP